MKYSKPLLLVANEYENRSRSKRRTWIQLGTHFYHFKLFFRQLMVSNSIYASFQRTFSTEEEKLNLKSISAN